MVSLYKTEFNRISHAALSYEATNTVVLLVWKFSYVTYGGNNDWYEILSASFSARLSFGTVHKHVKGHKYIIKHHLHKQVLCDNF